MHSVHFWITNSIPIDRVLVGSKKLLQMELKIMHLFQYVWFHPSIENCFREVLSLLVFYFNPIWSYHCNTKRQGKKTFWCKKTLKYDPWGSLNRYLYVAIKYRNILKKLLVLYRWKIRNGNNLTLSFMFYAANMQLWMKFLI